MRDHLSRGWHVDRSKRFAQHSHVALVLGNRRGHALEILLVVAPTQEFTVLRDLESTVEMLGFEHNAIEHAVNDQVINLGHTAVNLDAQVVDDDVVLAFLIMSSPSPSPSPTSSPESSSAPSTSPFSAPTINTLAGDGTAGFADGKGTAARLSYPRAIAVDRTGNLYVTDSGNNRIHRVEK